MTAKATVVKLMAPKTSTATKVENTINADFRDYTHYKIHVQCFFSERVRKSGDFKSHIYLLTKIHFDFLIVIQKNLNVKCNRSNSIVNFFFSPSLRR